MGGLSSDPAKRARQLANLKPAPPAPPAGNTRAVVHGGHSEVLLRDIEAEVQEIMGALADAAPVRENGGLPAADLVAVEQAARALRRYRTLSAWCDAHGRLHERSGKVKPAADLELRAERALGDALDVLGMNPRSRLKLGLDMARTVDLATAMSEPDPERREALVRQAGVQ